MKLHPRFKIARRLAAWLIDTTIILLFLPVLLLIAGGLVAHFNNTVTLGLLTVFWTVLLWPVLYSAIPTALFGRTPGKHIMGLSVTDSFDHAPELLPTLAREIVKWTSFFLILPNIITLFDLLHGKKTWYDKAGETSVVLSQPASQANFKRQLKPNFQN